jgi:outer membrane lipoprotein-sorting protein
MKIVAIIGSMLLMAAMPARQADIKELIKKVKAKIDQVNDYEAAGKLKTNVTFIKAPVANVKVYFKKPNKLKIKNESGISFVPRGSVNINLGSVLSTDNYEAIDMGNEAGSGLKIVKLVSNDDDADVVVSTLYIDEKNLLIKKAKTTTRENGTYELELGYGKYAAYGLPDKVVFTFNTKDYKLPKGVTFDYDDGSKKKPAPDAAKNKKGKVEISYSSYSINKGLSDAVFQ